MTKSRAAEYLASRHDLQVIANFIEPESRVMDLGCGDGLLLKYLMETKSIKPLGIEISQDEIIKCIGNGVPVIHGDLNEKLDYAQEHSFDYVILSCTLQEMVYPHQLLNEMLRIGHRAVVGIINFGFVFNRLQLLLSGKMPESKVLPHKWYSTPNIHLGTINDFKDMCKELDIKIVEAVPLALNEGNHPLAQIWPNLLAHNAVFVLEKNS